jgi:hypothetical protein
MRAAPAGVLQGVHTHGVLRSTPTRYSEYTHGVLGVLPRGTRSTPTGYSGVLPRGTPEYTHAVLGVLPRRCSGGCHSVQERIGRANRAFRFAKVCSNQGAWAAKTMGGLKRRGERIQSRRRCGRGEPSPGATIAGVSPVPAQLWPAVCALDDAHDAHLLSPSGYRVGVLRVPRGSTPSTAWEYSEYHGRAPLLSRARPVGRSPVHGRHLSCARSQYRSSEFGASSTLQIPWLRAAAACPPYPHWQAPRVVRRVPHVSTHRVPHVSTHRVPHVSTHRVPHMSTHGPLPPARRRGPDRAQRKPRRSCRRDNACGASPPLL